MTQHFKQLIFLAFFFSISQFSYALPTIVKGKVVQGNGMAIRASTSSDRLSFREIILDKCVIETNETFQLQFEINDIQEVFIKIGNQSFSFFAETGKNYQLQIDQIEKPPKSALSEQQPLQIVWNNKNALNEAIDNFNFMMSSFLEEHFIEIYKYRDTKLLQSFENTLAEKLNNTSTLNSEEKVFFENLITYQLADLKKVSRTLSDFKLGETYLKNKEVLYNHPSYMSFFAHYFNHYFVSGKRNTDYNDCIHLIQSGANISKLMEYLGKDPILEQQDLREMVLLQALKEVYYSTDFNSDQIDRLINEIKTTSKFPEHQKIAANILTQLTSLKVGAVPPEIKLRSDKGIMKSLADYKGSYVYLVFMSENCPACESDLAIIEKLQEKYKSDIAIVEIFVNYTPDGLGKNTNRKDTNWERLLFNNDFDLLNNYQIRTFPYYFLLNREAKILLNPAKKPNENIDRYFDFLIKRDKEKAQKSNVLFR